MVVERNDLGLFYSFISVFGNDLVQDRDQLRALMNTVMEFGVPSNAGDLLSCFTTGGFSRRNHLH
jgi:hypothetical protein